MEVLFSGGGLPFSMHKATWTAFSGFSGRGREWLHWLAWAHVLILFSEACQKGDHVFLKVACLTQDRGVKGWSDLGLTFDSTSALLSFCRSRAAAFVSSFRAAIWRAGRRTFPFVSFSSRSDTTWSWPCCRATASGVKPSCEQKDVSKPAKWVLPLWFHYQIRKQGTGCPSASFCLGFLIPIADLRAQKYVPITYILQ